MDPGMPRTPRHGRGPVERAGRISRAEATAAAAPPTADQARNRRRLNRGSGAAGCADAGSDSPWPPGGCAPCLLMGGGPVVPAAPRRGSSSPPGRVGTAPGYRSGGGRSEQHRRGSALVGGVEVADALQRLAGGCRCACVRSAPDRRTDRCRTRPDQTPATPVGRTVREERSGRTRTKEYPWSSASSRRSAPESPPTRSG